MQLTEQDRQVHERQPTVSRNTSLGREFYRSATWEDGDTTTKVTVVAFVTGIRARNNPDGSIELLGQVTRFDVLREGEYIQPVEVAMFFWDRERIAEDGSTVYESDIDHSNEIGLYYQPTVALAEEQCEFFVKSLDFDTHFDPGAWA